MRFSTLEQDQVNECYQTHRDQIFIMCYSFQKSYGGDIEDLLSEAHYHFVNIYQDHNEERGTFEKDLQFRLWKRLLESKRLELRRNSKLRRQELHDNISARVYDEFSIEEILSRLNKRAASVVSLVFNPTKEVELSVAELGGPEPKSIKSAIKEYLKDMGWSFRTICETFSEIKRAL